MKERIFSDDVKFRDSLPEQKQIYSDSVVRNLTHRKTTKWKLLK